MKNEEKAIELAENISPYDIGGDNAAHYAAKDAALDAMEWKDEQFLQWLKENLTKETFTMFTSESQGVINFKPIIKAFEKFKQAMKGK